MFVTDGPIRGYPSAVYKMNQLFWFPCENFLSGGMLFCFTFDNIPADRVVCCQTPARDSRAGAHCHIVERHAHVTGRWRALWCVGI